VDRSHRGKKGDAFLLLAMLNPDDTSLRFLDCLFMKLV
jgi:hypothetical protein